MKQETPGRVDARHRGEEIKDGDTPFVLRPPKNSNPELARKKAYENCGLEIARRGEINVSQFTGKFVDFPEDVQVQLFNLMLAFTRVPISTYETAGLLRFPARLIPLRGGRR